MDFEPSYKKNLGLERKGLFFLGSFGKLVPFIGLVQFVGPIFASHMCGK
jgi:hypothetical protein